jgi:cytochrome c-type biogenesis protein CcmH
MNTTIATLKRQLMQLKELHETGALPAAQYEESKATLERRLLDEVLHGASDLAEPATTAPTPSTSNPSTANAAPTATTHRTSRPLLAGLMAGVVVIAAAGYWWKGSPAQMGLGSDASNTSATGDPASPHATNFDQIAAMTERLAERLKEQPQDAEGWAMLARSYSVLGRHPEALNAYEKAVALRKDDATLLSDYADSLAVKNNRSLAGEPMKWVERALKIDPRNLKALSLAGTHAFTRKDYRAAVKYWEQVVQFGPSDNDMVKGAQANLVEARELAGLPPAAPAASSSALAALADAPAAGGAVAAAATGATVSGTVSLAPALAKQVKPDDTLFIYARAAEGSRMPLAILKKQVKDLPFNFSLDDSLAMSPAAKLSGAPKVIVTARISSSGNAMPQPGDLSGQTESIRVGASGIKLEIRDVIKP